jgi:hypothetical protein
LQDRKLSTPYDDRLNVCKVCLCPLKLKVHTPLKYISAHMNEAVLADLMKVGQPDKELERLGQKNEDPKCWIVEERTR